MAKPDHRSWLNDAVWHVGRSIGRSFAVILIIGGCVLLFSIIVVAVNGQMPVGITVMVLGIGIFLITLGYSIFRVYQFERDQRNGKLVLPWPAGWEPASGAARMLLTAGILCFGLFILGGGIRLSSQYSGLIFPSLVISFGLGLTLLSGILAVTYYPARYRRVAIRLRHLKVLDTSALLISSSRLVWAGPWIGGLIFASVAGVLIAVEAPNSALEMAVSLLVFTIGYLIFGLGIPLLQRGRLWLTPECVITNQTGRIGTISWSAIHLIQAQEVEPLNEGPSSRIITLTFEVKNHLPEQWYERQGITGGQKWRPRMKSVEIEVRRLYCDPAMLYHCLEFYWRNPEYRVELGNQAGINRIKTGNFIFNINR